MTTTKNSIIIGGMKLIDNTVELSNIDCHVHSRFSPDANECGAKPAEQIAEEARRKGLRGFIVTDHLDIGHWHGNIIDFDDYFKTWETVRRNNPDLTIYIGLEAGFEPETAEETRAVISDLPLEYVICSVHYWQKSRAWKEKENRFWLGSDVAYREYLDAVIASLDCPYPFSTVGHLGFPERYAPYPESERAIAYDRFKDKFDIIIKKAIERGVRFEENTNSDGEFRLPRADFLRAYKAAGGVRPVLGSDAHMTESMAQNFSAAQKFLNEIF